MKIKPDKVNKDKNIIESNIIDEYRYDTTVYAITENAIRMIPDLRDGQKTVNRRILDIMHEHRINNKFVKSASIVGFVMAKSHPHGNVSIYESLCNMSNWYNLKLPLIDGQGGLGTISGDTPSAERYTEAKLSEFAQEVVLGELKYTKNIVDWRKTYNDMYDEPEYLPVAVPLLLINGSSGVGYGIKCEVPSHNPNEVIDATINLIKNPNAKVVLIPDHCQKVDIVNTNWKAISNKGNGTYIARGIIDIEDRNGNGYNLIIKSTPDGVSLVKIYEKIMELAEAKVLQLQDIPNDVSKKGEMRMIIPLKKGIDPGYSRDLIYKKTQMEHTCQVNLNLLCGIKSDRHSYKSYLQEWINFRRMCKFRLYSNIYQNLMTKFHEKEAYIKVLSSGEIDKIIAMIKKRKSDNDTELIEYLINKYKITDLQASFIINTKLSKLSKAALGKYIEEAKIINNQMSEIFNKILNEKLIDEDIISELEYIKGKYGYPRVCKVIDESEIIDIPAGDFKLIVSDNHYIKKIPADYGVTSKDNAKFVITGCNTKDILLFDDIGRVFRLPIHKLTPTDKKGTGVDIRTIIKNCTSNIINVMYEPTVIDVAKSTQKYFIIVGTINGNIKKLDLDDFLNIPPSGIVYTRLEQGDLVKSIDIYHEGLNIITFNKNKALRLTMKQIPLLKRNAKGVKSFSSNSLSGISYINPKDEYIVVLTNKGFVNKFHSSGLAMSERNRGGTSVIKLQDGDSINTIISGKNNTSILKVKIGPNIINIPLSDIKDSSSISKGYKLLDTSKDNIIFSIIE